MSAVRTAAARSGRGDRAPGRPAGPASRQLDGPIHLICTAVGRSSRMRPPVLHGLPRSTQGPMICICRCPGRAVTPASRPNDLTRSLRRRSRWPPRQNRILDALRRVFGAGVARCSIHHPKARPRPISAPLTIVAQGTGYTGRPIISLRFLGRQVNPKARVRRQQRAADWAALMSIAAESLGETAY